MLDKRGDNIPPWGVPFVGKPSPIMSAFKRREIMESSALSQIPNDHICFNNLAWSTLSKNPLMSTSTQ